MKILIVGAGGLVGNALSQRLAGSHDIVALRHLQLDVTDAAAVHTKVSNTRPDLILNCAALGVDASEVDPRNAQAVNVTGAQNIAGAANGHGATLVHFSTNYVFDGTLPRGRFYTADDKANPPNVYGRTKLDGERAVKSGCERYFIVRTSWVFGRGKPSFFGTLPKLLVERRPVRAIRDMWANATYVNDLVDRVMEIVARGRFATYHVVDSGVCSYYDFALETARVVGLSPAQVAKQVEPVSMAEMNFSATRPRHTPMSCKASLALGLTPLREWRAALPDYVTEFK